MAGPAVARPRDFEIQTITVNVPAQATAASTQGNSLFVSNQKVLIHRIDFTPDAAITANGTNFFTWTVQDKGSDGTGTTSLGSRAWSATNSSAFVDENIVSKETNPYVLAAGNVLALARTVGASGLASPNAVFVIQYQEVDGSWQT